MTRPAIHPGETLAGELEELNITASQLARVLHVPTNRITQLSTVNEVSPPTALYV